MKSLLITPDFPPGVGGIQNYLFNLIRYLPSEEISVLCTDEEGAVDFDKGQSFKIYRDDFLKDFADSKLRRALLYMKILKIIKFNKIGLLQIGHVFPAGLIGLFFKKRFGIKYVVYTYAMEIIQLQKVSPNIKDMLIEVLKNADRVITISEYTRQELVKLGIDDKNIEKVFPGVDTDRYYPEEKSKELIEKHGLQNKKIILTVSRLVERKGHDMVIKALPRVIEKLPDLKYLIIGTGPEENRLKMLVKDFNLEKQVDFLGFVEDDLLVDYYNLCDLFIMPSRYIEEKGDVEGFGIVYCEANACTKPVIGGMSGGIGDAVIDNETGILVEPDSEEAIGSAIIKLLTNQDEAKKLGEQGRKFVKDTLTWEKNSEKLWKLINSL